MKPLMAHQVEGIEFFEKAGGRAYLADEMGLGKTRTVLEWRKRAKVGLIVITTKSFLYGWKEEAAKWDPEVTVVMVPKGSILPAYHESCIVITTYDVLWKIKAEFYPLLPAVVFDESHKLANADSKRSGAARKLVEGKKHVICLSGTPQPAGQPRQLWHQMLLVFPRFLKWTEFARRFCAPTQVWAPWAGRYGRMVWDYSGSSNEEELRALIAPRFLRRTKEVLNLPELTMEDVLVPVKTSRKSKEEWGAYAQRLALDKVKHTIALVDDVLERGGKVIVFTSFREVRDQVYFAFCQKAVRLTAETPANTRAIMVTEFQTDPECRVFVATTQIASEGLTLTAASTVIYNDLPFTPGALAQSQSRAHRKGADKPVHVYYVQSGTAFDKVVKETLESRQEVTEKILNERMKK